MPRRTFPLQQSNISRTPSPQLRPDYPSSPVKNVARHFAEHKRDEVQAFGYSQAIHKLHVMQDMFDFLDVPEGILPHMAPSAEKSRFTRANFVLAANILAESMRKEREYFLFLCRDFLC